MRYHNFWCISFVSSEFVKHVQKTPKRWEKVCSITIFHQKPEKTLLRLENPLNLPFFFPPLFQTIMVKSLGTLLRFGGVSQFTQVQRLPSPHKQCWTRVSRSFSEFQLCIGWGEGELQDNFEKDALFYEGTEKWQKYMNIAVLSQGLFHRIVGYLNDGAITRR